MAQQNKLFIKFLKNEFLTLTILGALGRSYTYIKGLPQAKHDKVKDYLRNKLESLATSYVQNVSESKHIENILDLSADLSNKFGQYFIDGTFRIGIAQKALNLYLKYLWCDGLIPEPPHCPIDDTIIKKLKGIKATKWTKIANIQDYLIVINAAKIEAGKKGQTLAGWELEIWR